MTFAEARMMPAWRKIWPLVWSTLPVLVLVQWLAVAPIGTDWLLTLELPYALAMLVAVVALPVLPLLAQQVLYFPLQNYPPHGFGGSLRKVRDWAYLHE